MTNQIIPRAPIALTPEEFIFASDNILKTNSLKVAEAFGKLHKDVLRKIEMLECSEKFSRHNFTPAEYLDEEGKPRPAIEMTKDGFMFLVMGFTGKKAAAVKEAYINAFNLMQDKLFSHTLEKDKEPTRMTFDDFWGALEIKNIHAVDMNTHVAVRRDDVELLKALFKRIFV